MGTGTSAVRKVRKLSKRHRSRGSISCFAPRGHLRDKMLVVAFSHCISDVSWQCIIALIEVYGDQVRMHAATDDYDHVKKIGDKNMLKYLNQQLFVYKVDLSCEASAEEFWMEVLKMEQTIDVFVLHMDQMCVKPFEDTGPNLITSAFESNFFAPLILIKTILPIMKGQKKGKIICINTIAGVIGIPLHSVYCSTKFAVEGLLESIASECIEHSITVSIIQTSLDAEQSPSKVLLELPTELNYLSDNDIEEKNKLVDETVSRLEHNELLKDLNVHKITKAIKEIIESKEPQFRYCICKRSSNLTSEKLKDPKGVTTIKEVSKFFMNADVS